MEKQTTYKNAAGFRCLRNIKRQTNDLYLVHCGQQQCPPGYTYDHKVPNEYHLHFVISGKGTLEIDKHVYHIKKNDIFLIPKGVPINYYADSEHPWEYIWITFDGIMADTYLNNAKISAEIPVVHSTIPVTAYVPMVQRILDTNQLTFANEIKRVAYLYEILSTFIEAQSAGKKENGQYDYPYETYIDYALQYIRFNYNRIRVNDIANYIGINRSYLTAIFKKHLQTSPQEYLINYRLKEAARLIKTTDLPIQEIAADIGYQNALTFSKMFKQIYGVSPKNYRELKI